MPKFFQEQLHVGHAAVGLQLATLHVAAFGLSIAMKDRVDAAVNAGRLSLRGVRRRAARGGYGIVAVGTMAMAMAAGRSLKPPALAFTLLLQVAWVGVTAQTFGHIGNYCKRSSSPCHVSSPGS